MAAGRATPKVAILGGGIIGASIGYHLALQGAAVIIVDRDETPREATACSFSWINASAGNPSPYYELRLQGLLEWRRLDEALGGELPLRWGGSVEWSEDPEELERDFRTQSARGYDVRLVGRDEIARLEPAIAAPPDAAVFAAVEGSVQPVTATELLLEAAQESGAVILRGEAARLVGTDGRAQLVLGAGPLEADVVVLAVGASSEALAAELGVTLPMANSSGLLVHSRPHPPLLQRLVLSPGAHIKQDLDGRVLAGESFGGGPVPNDPEAEGERLLMRVRERLKGAEGLTLERVTVGLRAIPRDGLPVLGFADEVEGLYLATMHSGITLAPVVGRLAAAEIALGAPLDMLEPFRPRRFRT